MLQCESTFQTHSTGSKVGQVDSKDSLENVESKWVGEIADNCQGVKLVLVALKCDLREEDTGTGIQREKQLIDYHEGLEVARRIGVRFTSRSFNRLIDC